MEEVWKDIDGYEGLYMVSNLGNVKSMNYANRGYAQNLVPKVNNSGRLWVELFKDKIGRPMLIHRLVAVAFIQNPSDLPQINHIDENPKNNVATNLEWCTGAYNIQYTAKRHPERFSPKQHGYAPSRNGKRKAMAIAQCTTDGTIVKTWPNSRTIFLETGMSDWSISQCCRGERKTAYGFKWQYAT